MGGASSIFGAAVVDTGPASGVVGAPSTNAAAFDSVNSTWYKSLIAIPGFLKNEVIGLNETL
jgi:hypothetical protein